MPKGDHPLDPRGLIMEAYRIDGITPEDCRTIFLDWALGLEGSADDIAVGALLTHYGADHPDHPMTKVLREGLDTTRAPRHRTGRAARRRGES